MKQFISTTLVLTVVFTASFTFQSKAGDFEVKGTQDGSGEGPILRVQEMTDSNTSLELEDKNSRETKIRKISSDSATNNHIMAFEIVPTSSSATPSDLQMRFFRDDETDVSKFLRFYHDDLPQAQIGLGTNNKNYFLNNMGLGGVTDPLHPLHVKGGITIPGADDLVSNGNFDDTSSWTGSNFTIDTANNFCGFYRIYAPPVIGTIEQTIIENLVQNDEYVLSFEIFANKSTIDITPSLGGVQGATETAPDDEQWYFRSQTIAAGSSQILKFEVDLTASDFSIAQIRNIKLFKNDQLSGVFEGAVQATQFIDNTPGWQGTPQEALNQVLGVDCDLNGHIDHSSLPSFARFTKANYVKCKRVFETEAEALAWGDSMPKKGGTKIRSKTVKVAKNVRQNDSDKEIALEDGTVVFESEIIGCEAEILYDKGPSEHRDIGAMVTMYAECIKALNMKNGQLQSEVDLLKDRLEKLEAAQ